MFMAFLLLKFSKNLCIYFTIRWSPGSNQQLSTMSCRSHPGQIDERQTGLNSNPWVLIVLIGFIFSLLSLAAVATCTASAMFCWQLTAFPTGVRRGCHADADRKTADADTSDTRTTTVRCNCSVIQTTRRGARARAARVSLCTHYLREAVCYGLERDQVASDWRGKWVQKENEINYS